MTATASHAIELIEEMISSNELSLRLNDQMLAGELYTLEQRMATVREGLEKGLNIDSNWVRESAHKIEERIAKRRYHYEHRAVLAHVRKAANPA